MAGKRNPFHHSVMGVLMAQIDNIDAVLVENEGDERLPEDVVLGICDDYLKRIYGLSQQYGNRLDGLNHEKGGLLKGVLATMDKIATSPTASAASELKDLFSMTPEREALTTRIEEIEHEMNPLEQQIKLIDALFWAEVHHRFPESAKSPALTIRSDWSIVVARSESEADEADERMARMMGNLGSAFGAGLDNGHYDKMPPELAEMLKGLGGAAVGGMFFHRRPARATA